jgi:hypothetical protein
MDLLTLLLLAARAALELGLLTLLLLAARTLLER